MVQRPRHRTVPDSLLTEIKSRLDTKLAALRQRLQSGPGKTTASKIAKATHALTELKPALEVRAQLDELNRFFNTADTETRVVW
jgi:hypothetical protein